ncbi:hypothetical protein YC2023_114609 [Brassica napus]
MVLHHARDAFTCSPTRLIAELRCIAWSMQSLIYLGYQEVIFGLDSKEALSALSNLSAWPRCRSLLERIMGLKSCFRTVIFEQESLISNSIVRGIARSVLRDGRFQSYLALDGPAWLHNMIQDEAHTNIR